MNSMGMAATVKANRLRPMSEVRFTRAPLFEYGTAIYPKALSIV
jgi:hypothetical protein